MQPSFLKAYSPHLRGDLLVVLNRVEDGDLRRGNVPGGGKTLEGLVRSAMLVTVVVASRVSTLFRGFLFFFLIWTLNMPTGGPGGMAGLGGSDSGGAAGVLVVEGGEGSSLLAIITNTVQKKHKGAGIRRNDELRLFETWLGRCKDGKKKSKMQKLVNNSINKTTFLSGRWTWPFLSVCSFFFRA